MEKSKHLDQSNKQSPDHNKLESFKYRHIKKQYKGKIKYYYSCHPTNNGQEVFLTMKSGSTYRGTLNSNKQRHGYGEYCVVNAGSYKGNWNNGFKEGTGTSYYRNQQIQYQGDWSCGEPHGQGVIYNINGQLIYQGQFKNGKSAQGVHYLDYKNKK